MKRYLFPLTALVALAVAAPAPAKEVTAVEVCGASGCHETKNRKGLGGFHPDGSDAQPPKGGGAFYEVTMTIRAEKHREEFTIAYLPGPGLTRAKAPDGSESWATVDAKTAALYDRLAKGLAPFPASQLGKVEPPVARVQSVLPAPSPPDDGGFPWLVVILGGAGAVALAGTVAMRRRLRIRRATSSSPAPTTAS